MCIRDRYIEDTGKSEPYNLLHIITTLSWGLGYFGMPHILLRFMAIEEDVYKRQIWQLSTRPPA